LWMLLLRHLPLGAHLEEARNQGVGYHHHFGLQNPLILLPIPTSHLSHPSRLGCVIRGTLLRCHLILTLPLLG